MALAQADRRGANRTTKLAEAAAAWVESNARQLGYGDRDSAGFLQQRPSQGWGPFKPGLAGVREDSNDFLDRALKLQGQYKGRPGKLAQAIQRSAFPDRYREALPIARQILRQLDGGGGAAAAAAAGPGGSSPTGGAPGFSPGGTVAMPAIDVGGPPQARVPSVGLQAPSFSAQAVMPQGSPGIPASGGGPAPKSALELPALSPQNVSFGAPAAQQRAQARVATGKGGLQAKATSSGILNSMRDWIVSDLGLPAGSRDRSPGHNAAVGGASDSDHIEGTAGSQYHEAEDFPTTAAQGGWGQYRKVVRKLGLKPAASGFTQGIIRAGGHKFRVQVIFGEANDHGDHIHVGIRRER